MTRGAIIVGASSGIGEALAKKLAEDGDEIGLAARRTERLTEIGAALPTSSYVATMDVTDTEDARQGFFELTAAMSSVDLVVISAGFAAINPDLDWEPERQTIDVNVRGFTAIATAAMEYFEEAGGRPEGDETRARNPAGHLVGISSVASHFGNGDAPAYNASKSFVTTYLDGLRYREQERDSNITITTIEPGFVDTDMSMGGFWECSPETAAAQITRAIDRERHHAYVVRRWRLVALAIDLLPAFIVRRLVV